MRNTKTLIFAACFAICAFVSVQGQGKTERRIVKLPSSGPSAAPISPAIVVGDLVFTSGQIGIDPKTGQMVEGGTEQQAEQVLKNLAAVLEAAGSDMSLVVKATVFLADMND